MSNGLTTLTLVIAIVGVAVGVLFLRDVIKRRFSKGLELIASAIMRFLVPPLATLLVIVIAALLIGGVSENWSNIVCWTNDMTGSLTRTCALHKISEHPAYDGVEILEVTGIADVTDYEKRVEFRCRPKPGGHDANSQPTEASILFRKYDDGWRPSL